MKTHKGMLTRDEFIKQFDKKIDMNKVDRNFKVYRVFKGVTVYYVYKPDNTIKNKNKYKLIMAIKKPDGEFYEGGVV